MLTINNNNKNKNDNDDDDYNHDFQLFDNNRYRVILIFRFNEKKENEKFPKNYHLLIVSLAAKKQ